MAEPEKPIPVKLFTGVLCPDPKALQPVKSVLMERFGPIDFESDRFPFDLTRYYEGEMGPGIGRWFWSFDRLIDPATLPEIKLFTNTVELDFSKDGGRVVNLDPGYLDYHKVILASVKDRAQKIYLSQGIYADPTLFFLKGRFYSYEWSLPDFRTATYHPVFLKIRNRYKEKLRTSGAGTRKSSPKLTIDIPDVSG